MYHEVCLLGTVASQCGDALVKQPGMGTWRRPFFSTVLCSPVQWCPTLCDPGNCSLPGSSVLGDSPGKNTGVGFHVLLQGIFPTQGLNQVSPIAGGFFTD